MVLMLNSSMLTVVAISPHAFSWMTANLA